MASKAYIPWIDQHAVCPWYETSTPTSCCRYTSHVDLVGQCTNAHVCAGNQV